MAASLTNESSGPVRTQSAAGRGERLYPARSSRVYWVLTQIRREMEAIAEAHCSEHHQATLIDFGCGNMPYRPLFEPAVKQYIGFDLPGNEMADRIMDLPNQLPLKEASADIVLSSQVLEHVSDPDEYIREAARVLVHEGILILSTHGIWRYHPDPSDFWRWTTEGLHKQIEDAGLSIISFRGILGPEATALQLLQDAVLGRIPKWVRQPFIYYMQHRIRRADRRCSQQVRDKDACVWFVVAQKN